MRKHSIAKISIEFTAPKIPEGIPTRLKDNFFTTGNFETNFSKNFIPIKSFLIGKKSRNATNRALSSLNAFFKPKQFMILKRAQNFEHPPPL